MFDPHTLAALDRAADIIRQSGRILFVTGAGVSADSGLPTYRGIGGLYNSRITDEGFAIEEALSGEMFAVRPDITWKYLLQIEQNCRGAMPNAAHDCIAWLEQRNPGVVVLTQNVDGFHRQAGSRNLIEIHGTLHQLYCTACGFEQQVQDYGGLGMPPQCAACGGVLRPDVTLFGEQLPEMALEQLVQVLETGYDAVFSIGTTSVFPYIAEPVLHARRLGVPSIEINPGDTQVSGLVDLRLRLGAASALAEIRRRLE